MECFFTVHLHEIHLANYYTMSEKYRQFLLNRKNDGIAENAT